MSLRLRVALAATAAVLVMVVVSSVALYVGVRRYLYHRADASLSAIRNSPLGPKLQFIERVIESGRLKGLPVPTSRSGYLQFVDADGRVVAHLTPASLPVTELVRLVARGTHPAVFFNLTVAGSPVRVYAFHLDRSTAVEIGASLTDVSSALHAQLAVSAVVTAAGMVLAVLVGALVAFAALRPVRNFSAAVRAVAETGELSHHVEVLGHDEFSQVAVGFNTMLDALDESLGRQRRLVADASHVLRTPLATVRTNVEVLRRSEQLEAGERAQLIRDTVAQLSQLTLLVNNLIELARGEEEAGTFGVLSLDELVASVVGEARRNYPTVPIDFSAVPSTVWGSPDRLHKVFGNLVDNAAKWTTPSTSVDVTVRERSVTVRDHGPGVEAQDVPHIFERFYRSQSARGVPGSGLGLAIAKQAVMAHGGRVEVRDAEGGGAEFIVWFTEPPAS